MLEKWKNAVDKGKVFGALLTDLSKAFDCLPHELIIVKLNAYGFNLPAVKLNKLLRSTMHIVHGRKYFLAFYKVLHLDRFCLAIVIRNGKIVWKHGPNRLFFLYNLSSENY